MTPTATLLLFLLGTVTGVALTLVVSRAVSTIAKRELEQATTAAGAAIGASVGATLQQHDSTLAALLVPIRDGLDRYDQKLHDVERLRAESFGALTQRLDSMTAASERLRTEAHQLVNALRSPNVRGQWGEIQLRRVCELAGMLEHCDFTTQHSVDGEQGRLRPDLVVHLVGGQTIVVDAKTPLHAYLDAMNASDDDTRRFHLREHARQLNDHVAALSRKAYWDQFEHAPELVVLFLPVESLFSAALEMDPRLIESSIDQRVIIATPTTLIALLKALAYGWRQERLAQNAAEISQLGNELYERLQTFGEHLEHVGEHLHKTVDAYNKAIGSVESRVLVSARRFRTLHATTNEEISVLEPIEITPRTITAPELTS